MLDLDDRREIIFKPQIDAVAAKEIYLGSTSRTWKACDVYVNVPSGILSGILSIWIYAVAKGVRTLVASGHWVELGGGAQEPRWIAAARAECEKFDVTYSISGQITVGVKPNLPFDVAIVASDRANEPPSWLGAVGVPPGAAIPGAVPQIAWSGTPIGFGVGLDPLTPANVAHPIELLGVHAISSDAIAGKRFVQIFDKKAAPANGDFPVMSFGLAAPGTSLLERFDGGQRGYRFQLGLWIAASTTAEALTLVAGPNDTGLLGWWR